MKYVLFRYSKLTNFNSNLIVIQNAYSQSLRVEMFTTYRVVKKKLYNHFLWMEFNCLKARATSRRQFTFHH